MPDERYIGPYRIDEVLGRGGVATVFKGYHKALDRTVAVKVISAPLGTDPDFIQRLRLEARTIARLRHPNILSVHDFGELSDLTYIVTEFVPGGTLSTRLSVPLRPDVVARLLNGIAAGLDYAHGEGIIHRDIKPSNILLAADDTPVIADFGLAKVMGGGGELTRTGAVMGTPEYMSPEQAMAKPLDARADVYSLGVVLYEMLTGSVPFESETPLATLLAHVHTPVPLPSVRVPALPAGVEAVVIKALAKEADDRYSSAGELAGALASAVESAENTFRPSGVPIFDSPPEIRAPAPTPQPEPSAPTPAPSYEPTSAPARVRPSAYAPELSPEAEPPNSPIGRAVPKRAMWPWFVVAPVGIAAVVTALVISRGSDDIRGSGPVPPSPSINVTSGGGDGGVAALPLSVPVEPSTPTITVTPTEEPRPSPTDVPTDTPPPSPQPTATAPLIPTRTAVPPSPRPTDRPTVVPTEEPPPPPAPAIVEPAAPAATATLLPLPF